ncbi:alpha-amylase family protein [Parvularcula dongshanensis]|uniref:Maltose alpha-D-glucosyltransferase/alpha-amylase n=1 Tax=Parvularcula dongshanensis TaxID=1173995 RepID=A0A840I5U4_9PROT|nr:alpha-amylase family protein [Parvularcula dongshanensis]MBB4659518.1 maltose alpha-D-glucosyltransferase/alpha-amylase [Parvularcula dongshanensis]
MIPDLWYKNAVIYSLSVDSFLDGNGDGVGDFRGLMRRLDYLQGLGVTAVWLMPFHPSPRRDHGYDVADYYGVDPRYGSLGDFVAFTEACRQRGIRVMMDLVINHTSDKHPWFQAALKDPSSKYKDYYIWAKKKPKDADDGVVFPGVQETTWTKSDKVGEYYFHKFYAFQPDLNIANPEVRDELRKVIGFWLALGVSGFRMDAVPFLIAADGVNVKDPEPAYEFLREIRAFAQWRTGDAVLLAEANIPPQDCIEYFGGAGDRLHMMFNFPVNQTMFYALAAGDSRPLREKLEASRGIPDTGQWANFLRNHDELDIGRLPDDQRQAVFDAFGPEPKMQLYDRGIRRRLAPMLGGDRRRMELAYSLMMTLPGTPVIRYGDEIGMGEDLSLKERLAARTPMQWSAEKNAGFTPSDEPVRPVVDEGPFAYRAVNVANQRRDPTSFLNWTERTIRMRKELPEIGWGAFDVLKTPPHILALRYDWQGRVSVFVHNLSAEAVTVRLDGDAVSEAGAPLVCLQTDDRSERKDGVHDLTLEAYGYRWYRVGGLEDMIPGDDGFTAVSRA